jgi:hypothetical protein
MFKQCSACNRNFEFVEAYWQFEDDAECVYCINGETTPEAFKNLEYVVLEDLDMPQKIEECFSHIDEPLPVEEAPPVVPKKAKKTPKNKG